MRRFLIAVTLFFAAAGLAPSAFAQEAATPEKIALVKRYFKAIDFEKMMSQVTGSMGPAMVEQMKRDNPELDEEKAQKLMQASMDATSAYMVKMMDRSAEIYAEVYTLEELEYMVSFYEDPRGKKILEKMPLVMPKATKIAMDLLPEFQEDMKKRVCTVIDCKAAKKPKA